MRLGSFILLSFAAACAAAPAQETVSAPAPVQVQVQVSPPPPIALPVDRKTANSGVSDEEMRARRANYAEAMLDVAERQKVFDDEPTRFSLSGSFVQGGLVFGQTEPGATVRFDGDDVMVGADGRFVFGFGRDSAPTSLVVVTHPDGAVERHAMEIEDRDFPVQRIDGLDQSKVSGFTPAQLENRHRQRQEKGRAQNHPKPCRLGGGV
ncbi:MAG: hypothetical protein GXP06_06815 [Alphaproteobacteria bacterium]|nr:hypothetical protein [Alphaproteobacteria bacterium]